MATTIHHLPPEILLHIFSFAAPTLPKLIHLRAVCHHWKSVVEFQCDSQRSLILTAHPLEPPYDSEYELHVELFKTDPSLATLPLRGFPEKRQLDFSLAQAQFLVSLFPHITALQINSKTKQTILDLDNDSSVRSIAHLLSNWKLETLSLDGSFNETKSGLLCDMISRLTSLSRLVLHEFISLADFTPLSTRLSQLEQLWVHWISHEQMLTIMSLLTTKCTNLKFYYNVVKVHHIYELIQANPQVVSNLKKLQFYNANDTDVLGPICDHFQSLEMLFFSLEPHYNICDGLIDDDEHINCKFTHLNVSQLVKLKNLTDLWLGLINIEWKNLERAQLNSLPKVEKVLLCFDSEMDEETFCRVFSTIFPNLKQLNLLYLRSFDKVKLEQLLGTMFEKLECIKYNSC